MITGFAVGAVLIVAPIVILAVWGDNAGIQAAKASLYIAVFAGVLAVAFSTAYAIRYIIFRTTLAKGRKAEATYLSCEMKSTSSAKDYYSVTYCYDDNGKSVTKTTGIVYTWEQALALKFAERFEITVYKGHSYVTQDVAPLITEHKNEIDEFKRAYAEAYNRYHNA